MVKIDRNNIRVAMKHLRNGNIIYLNGKRIIYNSNDKFTIEYTYNGENNKIECSGAWVRNFIKKDYLDDNLYLVENV